MSPFRALIVAATMVPSFAFAGASGIVVHLDEVAPVALSAPAGQVVVGNPSVADVTLTDRRHLMILGRTYGETTLSVLDGVGRRIYQTTVNVTSPTSGRVSMFRGAEVYNYACADRCERTPLPGESQTIFSSPAAGYTDYIGRAKTSATGGNNP